MTESVWDYPRPPRVETSSEQVVVTHAGVVLADTTASLRVLETSHPPTYYLPLSAFADGVLRPGQQGASWCEWKGGADYLDVVVGDEVLPAVAWTYPPRRRASRPSSTTSRSTPVASTGAPSTARSSSRSPATSTAAGSPHG